MPAKGFFRCGNNVADHPFFVHTAICQQVSNILLQIGIRNRQAVANQLIEAHAHFPCNLDQQWQTGLIGAIFRVGNGAGRICHRAADYHRSGHHRAVQCKMTTLTAVMLEAFAKGAALAVSVFLFWKQNTEER